MIRWPRRLLTWLWASATTWTAWCAAFQLMRHILATGLALQTGSTPRQHKPMQIEQFIRDHADTIYRRWWHLPHGLGSHGCGGRPVRVVASPGCADDNVRHHAVVVATPTPVIMIAERPPT
jgi:hypothetical protein